jgi:hypothetical protein
MKYDVTWKKMDISNKYRSAHTSGVGKYFCGQMRSALFET